MRRLVLEDRSPRIVEAQALRRDRPDETQRYRARLFVLASGYTWSPHLLLLSANTRFPDGLANGSGMVGRYMTGHPFITAQIEFDATFLSGHE